MSSSFEMSATARSDYGKAAIRRMRKTGEIPAVIYGDNREPTAITMRHDDLFHNLESEAFYSHVLSIDVDGNKEQVVLKDLQRHPARDAVLHADFLRVGENSPVRMRVPLHFVNSGAAPGIKLGGALNRLIANVEISCLASQLPDHIDVDLSGMNIGDSIRLTQIGLPEGVSITALSRGVDHDQAVATIQKTRGSKATADAEE